MKKTETYSLGERLKSARLYCGLTQQEVSSKMGISAQALSSWENNRNRPNPEDLIRLSAIYDMTIDALLGNGDKKITGLPNNLPLLSAYNRAPKQIQDIILAALAPYMAGREKEASA